METESLRNHRSAQRFIVRTALEFQDQVPSRQGSSKQWHHVKQRPQNMSHSRIV